MRCYKRAVNNYECISPCVPLCVRKLVTAAIIAPGLQNTIQKSLCLKSLNMTVKTQSFMFSFQMFCHCCAIELQHGEHILQLIT